MSTTPMPDPSAAVNALGASQPAPPADMGVPVNTDATQAAAPKPSLWKQVVVGALSGLANSSGATSFGGGLAKGAQGGLEAQRQAEQDKTNQNSQAQQQATAQQQQRVQTATAYANLAEINKRVSLLPPDRQTAIIEKEADNTANEQKAGEIAPAAQPSADWHDAQNQVNQLMQQNPGQLFIAKPVRGTDGKVAYQPFAAQDALTTADAQITLPDGKTITVPKGSVTGKALQSARITALGEQIKDHTKNATADIIKANADNMKANAAQTAANAKAASAGANSNAAEWKPKVTADEKKKAELAENMAKNAESAAAILQRRPDILGAVGGRVTQVEQLIGNNDPDISALGNEIHNYSMANSGIHGFRSQEGVRDTEKQILNSFKSGPRAVGAGLLAGVTSGQTFIDNARPETYKTHSKAGGVLKGMAQ